MMDIIDLAVTANEILDESNKNIDFSFAEKINNSVETNRLYKNGYLDSAIQLMREDGMSDEEIEEALEFRFKDVIDRRSYAFNEEVKNEYKQVKVLDYMILITILLIVAVTLASYIPD